MSRPESLSLWDARRKRACLAVDACARELRRLGVLDAGVLAAGTELRRAVLCATQPPHMEGT